MAIRYSLLQIYEDYKDLKNNFSWNGNASKRAFKTGLACIISILIVNKLNLGNIYWAAMAAIFSMQGTTTTSSFKIGLLYRAGGTICGALTGLFFLGLVIQNYPLLIISLFFLLAISFYLRYRSEHAAFWTLFGVTVFMIMLVGNDVLPSDITVFAFDRCSEIIIGAATAVFIDVYIWPLHATELYNNSLMSFKNDYSKIIKQTFDLLYEKENSDFEECAEKIKRLSKTFKSLESTKNDARLETQLTRRKNDLAEFDTVAVSNDLYDLNDFIHRTPKRAKLEFQFIYEKEVYNILKMLDLYLNKENRGKIQKGKLFLNNISKSFSDFEKSFTLNRKLGVHKKFNPIEGFVFYELVNLLKNFINFLTCLSENKYKINRPSLEEYDNFQNPLYKSDFLKINLFFKNIFLHKPTLKYSIQGAVVILLAIWLWKFLEVPGGNLSIAIAIFVVVLPETSACHTKGLMRFIGCAIGGVMGFAFLAMQIESTFLMCILVCVAVYFCAYLQTGKKNISYLGRQAGYAFVIAALPQTHPATEIDIVLNRFLGIFFGISCIWALRWFFWNDDVKKNFENHIQNIRKVFFSSFIIFRKIKKDNKTNAPFVGIDISSALVSLKILDYNNDYSSQRSKILLEWLNHTQHVFYRLNTLLNTNRKFLVKTFNINPEILNILFNIIIKLQSKQFCRNVDLISNELKKLNIHIEKYPLILRRLWDKKEITLEEKYVYVHIYIVIRRINRRLKRMFDLQKQLELLS